MNEIDFINGLKSLVVTLETAYNERSTETQITEEPKEEPKQEEKLVEISATEQLTLLIEKLLATKTQETPATTDTKNPTPPVAASTVKPSSEVFTPKKASEFLASFSQKG